MKTILCVLAGVAVGGAVLAPRSETNAVPADLVASYSSLADGILALNKAEFSVVRSILHAVHGRAERAYRGAAELVAAGKPAKEQVEAFAAAVAELGNEGDSAVAGIRKRLLEGGHHANTEGEKQGIFDDGFVIVTREAKKALLATAVEIGKSAESPTAEGLKAQWTAVHAQWEALQKSRR